MTKQTSPVPAKRQRRLAVPLNIRIWVPIAEKLDEAVMKQNTNRSDFVRDAIVEKLKKITA
ncbi:ribbon-helix-helix protein, CopG family [Novilysobacter arseniciresistens]|uniref:ribbon-helix-helix protein, CopG family n=1 Tax=Novilysobacter arseniciresistens TaxID=1385522 RepID=UPI00126A0C7D|nr:ribbon-helix-helix protein, CopG family [Lysobacter arseniciresistens]